MGKHFELQPLRLTSGWTVEFNNFCECHPDDVDCLEYLIEDLLQLTISLVRTKWSLKIE